MQERIAIIGAGIVGSLAAHEVLKARPDADVVLIDRDLAGHGASRHSAGVHFPIGKTDRARAMSAFSEHYYTTLLAEHPRLPIYPVDLVALASPEAAAALRQTFVSPDELEDVPSSNEDLIRRPPGFAAWRVPKCHHADVGTLVRMLASGLRRRLTLLEGVSVDAIAEESGGIELSLGTGERLRFQKALLAPGPWIDAPAWRAFTTPLGLRVKKVVALHLDLPIEDRSRIVVLLDEDAFLAPLGYRGHWLFSYTCPEWDVSPDDLRSGISEQNLREARDVLSRYAPSLAPALHSGRAFCDAYSSPREPVVRVVGESGNLVFAGAANGSGYRLAPAMAVEATRLLIREAR